VNEMAIAEAIKISDLNSIRTVTEVMEKNQLPRIPQQALIAIGKSEGETFKKALVAIANNTDPADEFKNYVYKVTGLLTQPIMAGLVSLGFSDVPPSILIKIGKQNFQEFRAQLTKAMQGDKNSQAWIANSIRSNSDEGQAAPTAAPQQRIEAPAPMRQPEPNNVQQMPSRPTQRNTAAAPNDDQPYPGTRSQQGSSTERQFSSLHLYGGKAAHCYNLSEKDGVHSINLDAAKMVEGQRKVNWDDSVRLRFTERELFSLYACLIGLVPKVEFKSHGAANDKSYTLERQTDQYGTKFFASCSAKDKGARGVPFALDEGVRLSAIIMRQLIKNYPEHTPESLDRLIRSVMTARVAKAA
jgi:hypothetical protein